MPGTALRWLFADQLGPHYLDDRDQPVLLVESAAAFRRRPQHRARAHLLLVALRRRARELGDRAVYVRADSYREAVESLRGARLECVDPTSYAARALVRRLGATVLPARGFVTSEPEFAAWAAGRRRLRLEDFYRAARMRTGVLMDGDGPAGGRWNLDADNRLPPPRGATTLADAVGVEPPWLPAEDDVDDEVRADLDRWSRRGEVTLTGDDGPRLFASSAAEATAALDRFVETRLAHFGPYEDAVLTGDWAMAHSLLSAPMNLGLLDPFDVVDAAERAYRTGQVPLASAEGFVRQVMGWRDYVWHLYWHRGPGWARGANALGAGRPLPGWFRDLRDADVRAACLRSALGEVRRRGWAHHIVRLMVLGNWALQRGYDPVATTEWFRSSFVDGHEWVMAANVVGMALYADGGATTTKPYAAGGAYLHRMTDHCRGCRYRPDRRVGPDACPFTAGYWWFLDREEAVLRGNHRLAQPYRTLDRLADRAAVVAQERVRGDAPP